MRQSTTSHVGVVYSHVIVLINFEYKRLSLILLYTKICSTLFLRLYLLPTSLVYVPLWVY